MHRVDRHSKSISLGKAALQTERNSYFMKIIFFSLISNLTDAFQLICETNPSEKFTVENILDTWTSYEDKY